VAVQPQAAAEATGVQGTSVRDKGEAVRDRQTVLTISSSYKHHSPQRLKPPLTPWGPAVCMAAGARGAAGEETGAGSNRTVAAVHCEKRR